MNQPQLPFEIERNVSRIAEERHISHGDAIIFLIETGLKHLPSFVQPNSAKTPAEEVIGVFSSDEDCALVEQVVSLVYAGRKSAAQSATV